MSVLEGITHVVADSDLDGLMAAAVLKACKPDIEVIFAHAALVRGGSLDEIINRNTAMCDLPFHPDCGLYLDHHMTNRPTPEQEAEFTADGGICHWRDTPSAARAAFELMRNDVDLSHLEEIMPMVDALDSGGISFDVFMEDPPILRLSRSLSLREPDHLQIVLDQFATGMLVDDILSFHSKRLEELGNQRSIQAQHVKQNTVITDGLAICDLSNSGIRTNGYLVTALAGDEAIACCVIHGWDDGSIDDPSRPALGASFYANSFRGVENPYDLSKLATLLDETGGGHANACGCRIQPADGTSREIQAGDKEYNLAKWLDLWSSRKTEMLRD